MVLEWISLAAAAYLLRRLRGLDRRLRAARSREEALGRALADLRGRLEGMAERPAEEAGAEPGERISPAMLEGFDNLMRYTAQTAREKAP